MAEVSRLLICLGLVGVASALCLSKPADASSIMFSYTGLVDAGQTDQQGYFGAPGGDISYKVFVASFTLDPTQGRVVDTASGQILEGGQYYRVSSPYTLATVEIGGSTISAVSLYSSAHASESNVLSDLVSGFDSFDPYTIPYTHYDYLSAQLPSDNLPTTISASAPLAVDGVGSGSFTRYLESYQGNSSYYQTLAENFTFTITFATGLVNIQTVPEPSNWFLMLIGFAAIGSSIRRQRQVDLANGI